MFAPIARSSRLALISTALASFAAAQGSAPLIQSDLPPNPLVLTERTVSFELSVSEPDGDPVDLVCLNPPPNLRFTPTKSRQAPFTTRVRLYPDRETNQWGALPLVFEARDTDGSTRLRIDLTLTPTATNLPARSVSQAADVTGDGVMDLVILATRADVEGVVDTGAGYLWRGGSMTSAPDARLIVPSAQAGDLLGAGFFGGGNAYDSLQVADLTADGIDDILIAAPRATGQFPFSGAMYLWEGGQQLSGDQEPVATLIAPGSGLNGSFPSMVGQPVVLADVTGDGLLDVVAACENCGVDGVSAAGAIYVWEGGPGLVGQQAPRATLVADVPTSLDFRLGSPFGSYLPSQGLAARDLTGDGIAEVIALAPRFDFMGVLDSGAACVWHGGAGLIGQPSALLGVPNSRPNHFFGQPHFVDVTGDGIEDVIVSNSNAEVDGATRAGHIWMWSGGREFEGQLDPTAELAAPGPNVSRELGQRGLAFADVDDDGVMDIIAAAPGADIAGPFRSGAMFIFRGGTLSGTALPWSTLVDPNPQFSGRLGNVTTFRLEDLNEDGVSEIIVPSRSIFVWRGGGELAGVPLPLATLDGSLIEIGDVTGDGILDVVGHENPDLRVWPGGASFSGSPNPATLTPTPGLVITLGGVSVLIGDVSGNGVSDIVRLWWDIVAAYPFRIGGVQIWEGGLDLASGTPSSWASLVSRRGGKNGISAGPSSSAFFLRDLSGDGVADIISTDSLASVNAVPAAGTLLYWEGGQRLSSHSQASFLTHPRPVFDDMYGEDDIVFADLSGDGTLDVTALGPKADVGGIDTGAALYWVGPPSRSAPQSAFFPPTPAGASARQAGTPSGVLVQPDLRLAVPGAVDRDGLGD